MKEKFSMIKGDPDFKKKMEEIRLKRIQRGVDNQMQSFRRITKAMVRYSPLWDTLEKAEFVKEEPPKKNKRGQVSFQLFTFMAVAFLAVVMFAGMIYIMGLINIEFVKIGLANEVNAGTPGYVNMTEAAANTIGQVNNGVQSLRLVALCMIFAMIIGTFIENVAISRSGSSHPAFFIVHVLIVIFAVILAATISNAYESLLNSGVYDGGLLSFTGSNWILLNLPYVVAVVGLIGGLFLFVHMISLGNERMSI